MKKFGISRPSGTPAPAARPRPEMKNEEKYEEVLMKPIVSAVQGKVKEVLHEVRIMAVGCSGVGKSTIGNQFLTGNYTGDFHTAGTAESVTKISKLAMNGRFSYVDVPGIPDTNMGKTKEYYNMIVSEAKKPVNVILFVFKFERIDVRKFQMCKLLFRELKRCSASKVLVINDMRSRGFGGVKVDEAAWAKDMQVLSDQIEKLTDITFHGPTICVNSENFQAKIKHLKHLFGTDPPATANPHLRTFDELLKFKELMKDEKKRQKAIVADAKRQAKSLEERAAWSQKMVKVSAVGTAAVTAPDFLLRDYLGSSSVTAPAYASIAGWGCAHGMMAQNLLEEAKEAKSKGDKGSRAQKKAEMQLKEAIEAFKELKEVLE